MHNIQYDDASGKLVITAILEREELRGFNLELEQVINSIPRRIGDIANWHAPLVELLSSEHGRQHGFIAAIKLWRAITKVGLIEARDEIEAFRDYGKQLPYGTEYDDVPPDIMDWVESYLSTRRPRPPMK